MHAPTQHNQGRTAALAGLAKAWALSFVRPIHTARFAETATARQTLLVHVAGLPFLPLGLIALSIAMRNEGNLSSLPYDVARTLGNVADALFGPADGWIPVVASLMAIEASIIIAARALMLWGARCESKGACYWRTVRRLMLLCNHAALIAFVSACLLFVYSVISRQLENLFPETIVWIELGGTAVPEILSVMWPLLIWVWGGLITLRVVREGDFGARCSWPASCEGCGYLLVGMQMDQTCPECGREVGTSLDPAARPGCTWDQLTSKRFTDTAAAYVMTASQACLRPTALGRSLQALTPTVRFRSFFLVQATLTFFANVCMMIGTVTLMWWIFEGTPDIDELFEILWYAVPISMYQGAFAITGYLCVSLISAGTFAWGLSRKLGRPVYLAAAQVAIYQNPLLTVWLAALYGYVITAIILSSLAEDYFLVSEIIATAGLFGLFVGLNLFFVIVMLWLQWRAIRAAIYANQ